MNYILLIVVSAFIVEVIKEHQKIFTKRPEWQAILMVFLLGVSAYCIYFDNTETTGKIDRLSGDNKTLKNKVDSFKSSFDIGLSAVAANMSYNFGEGVKKEDNNTAKILINAFSNKNVLIHKIDSMQHQLDSLKESQLPNVTFTPNQTLKCIQTNDTFYVILSLANTGGTVAKNVNFKMFYLYKTGNNYYEYYTPIAAVPEGEIPTGEAIVFQQGSGTFMTNFHFDSTNESQYIFVLGTYTNDDGKHQIEKNIKLCYAWNSVTKVWGISPTASTIEKIHNSKSFIYFKHFP